MKRRHFLISSIGTTLALPSLPSLMAKAGNGDSVRAAKGAGIGARRFVAIGNLLGYQTKSLFPSTPGRAYAKTTLLEPVWEVRDKLTVFRGLDHGIKGGHFAVHSFLSGVLHSEARNRPDGNVTIDQYIADAIGFETRFPSLTVGSEGGIHGGCQIAWTKSGVRVPPVTNPAELFERLFVSDSPTRQAHRAEENKVQASILDSVLEEANRLSKKVNREDKAKLEEYLTSVRDVEKRLELRRRWTDQPKPKAPFEKPSNRNAVEDLPLLYELIALALQTDSTRIATLEIGGDFMPQHLGIEKDWHGLSHHGNDPEAIASLITLERYQIDHFGKFVARLAKINDGERSLLDSTTVLFGSGMGDGNAHKNSDLPILLAGGDYRHGTFREVPREGVRKVPLCNLFVDIAQKMGVETDSFGSSTGRFV
ncbi:MAG: DUF1552 domain-containing protein [Verrucomicrobia bacterium]|nr:DUF1552 domain-containing protein [Verrucomicrobiota bacterium]